MSDYLQFEGRCHLEGCPKRRFGHGLDAVTMTLRTNKRRTEFWYESSCAPGQRQPSTAAHEAQRDMLSHLRAWQETEAVLHGIGVQAPLLAQERVL